MINKDNILPVKNFEEACDILRQASEKGESVVLKNAKELHKFGGFMYVKEMLEKAVKKYPGVEASIIYDAGNDAVAAISAVSGGFKKVRFTGDREVYRKLIEIATRMDAEIFD